METEYPRIGEGFSSISEACRKLGVSRQHYYDIRRASEGEGLVGLLEKSRRVPRIGTRVAPEMEQKMLDYSLQFPVHGQARVANERKSRPTWTLSWTTTTTNAPTKGATVRDAPPSRPSWTVWNSINNIYMKA